MDRLSFDERVKIGYEEYLLLPEATCSGPDRDAELYKNGWCITTGLACIHPHPHRHYSLIEFAYWCGKKEDLYNRFIKI